MIFTPHEYLGIMEKLGLFRPDHPVPDCNSAVWRAYFELYKSHIGTLDPYQIVCTPQGLGFYLDPLEEDAKAYVWALLGPISHPMIPFTPEHLVTRSRDIFETFLGAGLPIPSIQTETFDFLNTPDTAHDHNFVWVNSPRARIHDNFETYANSLTAPRRKQMRRLFRTFDETPDVICDFSNRPLDTTEIDYVVEQTHKRWGEDEWAYALIQSLWTIAVSSVMPDRVRFMRVTVKDCLAFINSYILRDTFMLSQSTCRNEDLFMSGLGVMIDFKTIQLMSGNTMGIQHLDPTCRICMVDDYEHISVAKREIVNEDNCKPLFMAGINLPRTETPYPYFSGEKGWVIPDERCVVGKAA